MTANPFPYIKTAGDPQNPAIVFLHGGGLSSHQWQPQMAGLSDRFYCLAPDLPEQGQSVSLSPFTLADAAERVIALIRTLAARKAHVVGLSLGGAVALEVARRAPEAVDHLVVSGTAAGLSRWMAQLSVASAYLYRFFKPESLVTMSFNQFKIPDSYRPSLHDDLLKGFSVDFTRHFTEALTQIQIPTQAKALVMVGEKETVVAKRDARTLAKRIGGARGVVAPKVGHVWNLETADLFTATVAAFVTDSALPAELMSM